MKWLHNDIYITARLNTNAPVPAVYNTLISGFWAKRKKILTLTNQVLSATEYYHKSISNTWGIVVRYIACGTYIRAILVFISLLPVLPRKGSETILAKMALLNISKTWRDVQKLRPDSESAPQNYLETGLKCSATKRKKKFVGLCNIII